MRAVVQRVKSAKVVVGESVTGSIGKGLLIFLGIGVNDSEEQCDYMVDKIANLRVFSDQKGLLNQSLMDTGFEALVVSQFTLYGDCRKGRRPSFTKAAKPDRARELYEYFIKRLKEKGLNVQSGIFQAMMEVYLINDGPVTLLLDSEKVF